MKSRGWRVALGAMLVGVGIAFMFPQHSPDAPVSGPGSPLRTSSNGGSDFQSAVAPAERINDAPDAVPPPHEVSAAPPLGFALPPDNEPLPPPEQMDELLKLDPAADR